MKRRAVELQCHQKYYDLVVLLRVMQSLDPDEFAQVPECLLTGLKNYRLNDARNKCKTQDDIAIRLKRMSSQGMKMGPYADNFMDAALVPLTERVRTLIRLNLVSSF